MKTNAFKIIISIILLVLILGGFFGYRYYKNNYANNVAKEGILLIPKNADFSTIKDSISQFLIEPNSFDKMAKAENLDKYFHTGRYEIKAGKTNKEIVQMIKLGEQSPLNFRIGDFYNVYHLAGRVNRKTEMDSLQFCNGLDKIAAEKGLRNAEDLKKYFFIDTYQFFWTVTPEEFFKKFEDQYNAFWNAERTEKERLSRLTRDEIYALASIVYKESGGMPDEMRTIAGLYLNRYRKGMKLQSDPTVIYTVLLSEDFRKPALKRVLYRHLAMPSPYNTYANAGIPPGPICVVDKNSVDAVLNPEQHNYIFMAADPNRRGYHNFTASGAEHAKNAKVYQEWISGQQRQK